MAELDKVLLRRGNLVATRGRVVQVGALVVLVVVGALLPYVTISYLNDASEPVTSSPRLFGAASLLGGLDPSYLEGYRQSVRSAYDLALNLSTAGPGLQQIGSVVAVLACWALLTEEINRIAWFFLHASGYPLVLAGLPLLIGVDRLHALDVPVSAGVAWIPSLLAGVLVLVTTWRARKRIDTYGSF